MVAREVEGDPDNVVIPLLDPDLFDDAGREEYTLLICQPAGSSNCGWRQTPLITILLPEAVNGHYRWTKVASKGDGDGGSSRGSTQFASGCISSMVSRHHSEYTYQHRSL